MYSLNIGEILKSILAQLSPNPTLFVATGDVSKKQWNASMANSPKRHLIADHVVAIDPYSTSLKAIARINGVLERFRVD